MLNIKRLALYIPVLILLGIFGGHAIGGLMQDPEFLKLVGTLGFDAETNRYLVYSIFLFDGLVVLFLLLGSRICDNFPWKFLYIWVGLWPWIPRYLEMRGGYEMEWGEALFITVLAFVAYKLHTSKSVKFFPRKNTY